MRDSPSSDVDRQLCTRGDPVPGRKHLLSLLRSQKNHDSPSQGYTSMSALSLRANELFKPSASSYVPDLKRSSIFAAEPASAEHIVCSSESCDEFASCCRSKRASRSLSSTLSERRTNAISDRKFWPASDPVSCYLNQCRPKRS
jgi:hypothetical protein